MMEVLQFIFQDFWHWAGICLLLAVVVNGCVSLFRRVTIIYPGHKDHRD